MSNHPELEAAAETQGALVRIGAVSYLNTKPLVYGLAADHPEFSLEFDLPSRLADRLRRGEFDIALIPSIEYFQHADYRIVSDACIGCRGPVLSVKVVFRCPPSEVRTLAVDEGSRTSAALARILLSERFGLRPELVPFPIGSQLASVDADAVVIIGDRAIHLGEKDFDSVWDLGEEWCRWSELPFVFAMWVARPGIDTSLVESILAEARDVGLAHLNEIAAAEASRHGLSVDECFEYFHENLHFRLGGEERAALELFQHHATRLEISPARWIEEPTGKVRLVESLPQIPQQ
jgi:chorismate dehydratase